jgi:hypothetical protein
MQTALRQAEEGGRCIWHIARAGEDVVQRAAAIEEEANAGASVVGAAEVRLAAVLVLVARPSRGVPG